MRLQLIKSFCYWFLGTFVVLMIVAVFLLRYNGASWEETRTFLPELMNSLLLRPRSWLWMSIPFLISRLVRYLYRSYQTKGRMVFFKRSAYTVILPVFLLFGLYQISQSYVQSEQYDYTWDHTVERVSDTVANRYHLDQKQRGIHFFGGRSKDTLHLHDMLRNNVEWLTFVPFGSQKDYDSRSIGRRKDSYKSFTARDSAFMHRIDYAQSKGFYVMMKPHIWIYNPSAGKWRSDLDPKGGEAGWQEWSANYRRFILHYARMSEMVGIELFCIGTELHKTVKDHPQFWVDLIQTVRSVYSGKITYAANWNEELDDVFFWDQLDYIGIQAYFPLTKKSTPTIRALKKGWKPHLRRIESLHRKYQRPILFTELGYKSSADAAITPWEWPDGVSALYKKISFETQANCYEAFFQSFWDKDWFAGVHFWQWQGSYDGRDPSNNINFSPQYKPAENVMAKWFREVVEE